MGTWGEGNYDSDGAADTRDELIKEIEGRIADICGEEEIEVDGDGEEVLMPYVAIILLLCKHAGAMPPRAPVITAWRDKYLENFDEQIEDLDAAAGYAEGRRKVIEDTFNELIDIAGKSWSA
jgi:hypothetical protein